MCCLTQRGLTGDSLLLQICQWCCLTFQGSPVAMQYVESAESFIHHGTLRDLFVYP